MKQLSFADERIYKEIGEAILRGLSGNIALEEPTFGEVTEEIEHWIKSGIAGHISKKGWSRRYTVMQKDEIQKYLKKLNPVNQAAPLTIDSLRQVLSSFAPIIDEHGEIKADRFATKRNIFDAYISLVKHMIQVKKLPEIRYGEASRYRPIRTIPPKKKFITTAQKEGLMKAVLGEFYGKIY